MKLKNLWSTKKLIFIFVGALISETFAVITDFSNVNDRILTVGDSNISLLGYMLHDSGETISLFFKLGIFAILFCIFLWSIIIGPYKYYKFYKNLSIEDRKKTFPLLEVERYIFYGSLSLSLVYLYLADLSEIYLRGFIYWSIVRYVCNMFLGIYLYIKGDKILGKTYLIKIHLFLLLFLIFYLLAEYTITY